MSTQDAKKIWQPFVAIFSFLYLKSTALAVSFDSFLDPWGGPKQNITDFAFGIINYALVAAGLVAVIYIIISGFMYVTSGGNEETSKKATKALLNAVIGLVVIFAAYAIVISIQDVVAPGIPGIIN
ncbi:MAG: TrbC/VirB2 family protein [Patescibacteria group bacterium]